VFDFVFLIKHTRNKNLTKYHNQVYEKEKAISYKK